MKAISARNLCKTYWFYDKEAGLSGSLKALFRAKRVNVEAVREISLDVELGELVGFIGPNGAGKTTTLKMLSGILHPSAGWVEVMKFRPFRREKEFLKTITLVTGQRNRLFWDLPAEDYFQFCKVVYEIPLDVYRRNFNTLVELADIGGILKVPQRKLSFGQRKRCELVAALLHDPSVIFLDEPTNAVDLINARKIREFIREKAKDGLHTTILTSHNMSDIEQVCDRIIIVNQGKIVFDGNIRDLMRLSGFKKQVRVLFNGLWSVDQVRKVGDVKEMDGKELLLEVETDKAASVASYLFANFPVQDIGITDPPLEQVIESIYLHSADSENRTKHRVK
jgi:ABC-2 type transport system ATP-binding protein